MLKAETGKINGYQFTKITADKVAECHILTTIETKAC